MADFNKREVKAKSDLDNVLDSVKQEETEKKNVLKNIVTTETLIASKSTVRYFVSVRDLHWLLKLN